MVANEYSTEKSLSFSVPQGSMASPILHNAYASTLEEVVSPQIDLHSFAYDHTVKYSLNLSLKRSTRLYIP